MELKTPLVGSAVKPHKQTWVRFLVLALLCYSMAAVYAISNIKD